MDPEEAFCVPEPSLAWILICAEVCYLLQLLLLQLLLLFFFVVVFFVVVVFFLIFR